MLSWKILRAFDDALMPLRCVFCGTRTRDDERHICSGCFADLPWREAPMLPAGTALECVRAPLAYAFPLDMAIKALKFRRRLYYGPALAQLLCHASGSLPDDIDAVLPVPLHWRRKWWRGFNQALEIAKPLARHLGVPIIHDIRRRRATPPQSGLSAAQRARNLRSAFTAGRRLHHRHVLIVDDVITTGATIEQVARTLRRGGADAVSAIAVATAGQR